MHKTQERKVEKDEVMKRLQDIIWKMSSTPEGEQSRDTEALRVALACVDNTEDRYHAFAEYP